MKKKKEIEIPKNKYIYQRYNGIITKYIVDKEYYIDTETGIARQKDETAFLGKVSENIIDLIEVEDFVNGYKVLAIEDSIYRNSKRILIYKNDKEKCERWIYIQEYDEKIHTQDDIVEILTHEQYEQNCYKLERK